jgi:nucleotide-binding universal stress UspA family protein
MPLMSSGLGVDTDRALEPLVDTTERWLETTVAGLRGRVESLTTSVAFGDPATEIMAADARVGADLVVIGRGGVGRLVGRLLDGTTQRVLRVGDSALLIVPAARAPAQ